MAATKQQSSTPSFFNFLKEGFLLPSRNRRLFVAIFAILVASASLLFLGKDLAVQPVIDKLNLDTKALNTTDPGSPEFGELIQDIKDGTRNLLLVTGAYALLSIPVASIVRVIVLFAAVATFSGEAHTTFREVLGKTKAQLKGPLVTLAFVYALEIAYVALLAVLVGILVFLFIVFKNSLVLLFVLSLVVLLATIFFVYFSFLCSLSVVVAVAEPGCRGAAALGRAWHLVKGKRRRAALFISVTGALATVVTRVYTLARACAPGNMASGLLLEFVYNILMAAVGLFATCAMTAFYYECKENTEASEPGYVKLSTQEQISV